MSLSDRLAAFVSGGPPVYVVGGAVRDRLLGREVHDIDLVVAADALRLGRRLADHLGGAYVTLDEEQATARILVGSDQIDVARQRGGSLETDLLRRDFSVNAMAVPLVDWAAHALTLVDPADGRADLAAGVVRAVYDDAFRDDPGRLLRAPRLAAQLGGRIEPHTETLIQRDAALLARVSPERVRDELWRILLLPGTAITLGEVDRLGLLAMALPDLATTRGVTQRPPHVYDVFDHSLAVVAALEGVLGGLDLGGAPAEPVAAEALAPYRDRLRAHLLAEPVRDRPRWSVLKFAALYHDVGKPATRSVGEDGVVHFYRHEIVGADMIQRIARDLKLGTREIAYLTLVIRQHLRPLFLAQQAPLRARAQYRYFRDTKDAAADILLLSLADNRGKGRGDENGGTHAETVLATVVQMLDLLYAELAPPVVAPPPLLSGRDLMAALDLRPGPQVGKLLEKVREAAATGQVTTREEAVALARRLAMR